MEFTINSNLAFHVFRCVWEKIRDSVMKKINRMKAENRNFLLFLCRFPLISLPPFLFVCVLCVLNGWAGTSVGRSVGQEFVYNMYAYYLIGDDKIFGAANTNSISAAFSFNWEMNIQCLGISCTQLFHSEITL